MSGHVLRQILGSDQIIEKVRQLGTNISFDYKDLNPVLIGVLNGSFIFFGRFSKKSENNPRN